MRIRLAIPDRLVTPEALEAALEATTLANAEAISRGEVPALSDAISRGVRWQPEPYLDGEHFDLSHQVARRGWGDCDDLAPWLAGELRASGEDEGARPRVYKTGPDRWHVVVETSDGEILDPSKWAGMGKRSSPNARGVSGRIARPTAHPHTGMLAVMPHQGAWWSRVDLPWPDAGTHIASHARASTPERALDRAMRGAVACGHEIESPLIDRAMGCGELLLSDADAIGEIFPPLGHVVGAGWDVLTKKGAREYREQVKAAKAAADAGDTEGAKAILDAMKERYTGPSFGEKLSQATPLLSAIPGGGLATTALSVLTKGGKGGKTPRDAIVHPSGSVSVPLEDERPDHGQHMFLSYHPAGNPGPVVMRF